MKNHRQSGNAFLYILIAIVLFAGLTFVLSRGHDSGDKTVLNQAQVQTTAQRLMSYVNQTTQGWLQMSNTGTDLDELDLTLPSDVTFNNAPTIHKLFHPDGGGVLFREMNDPEFIATPGTPEGWYFVLVDTDWSPSTATDFMMFFTNLKQSLCAQINLEITQSTVIPVATFDSEALGDGTLNPLTEATCASCKTHASICIQDSIGRYVYFNTIEQR
jgi:hypothetical protein